jgi:serine/threonine protein kinase
MKSYDHCEFEHERVAFAQLGQKVPERDDLELYPSVYIADQSRNVYHECDLLVIAESFAAVVELKEWRGTIDVADNVWRRNGSPIRDPHEVNLPKAKVFKGLLEQELPSARVPFVQSIVVLTAESASVRGAHSAFDVINRLDQTGGKVGDHLTFDGVDEVAKYLRERIKRDAHAGRRQLSSRDFNRLKGRLDERFASGPRREDYADQISGFKILQEIENTTRYVSYLAEASPVRGEMVYRLRVFGPASSDPAEQARQFRSLDTLERLPPHPNIRAAHRHPNERNLVVEVCAWNDVQTLDQLLESGTSFSRQFVASVVRDLARALVHVHSDESLIHRNLTPRSVIIGRDDHVELTDFDLAFDAGAEYTVLVEGSSHLERSYLAPEALAGRPDLASDIYSLGRVLDELLKSIDEPEGSAFELRELAERMCGRDPSERPTANDVADELSDYLGETQRELAPSAVPTVNREPRVGDTHDTWELLRELGQGGSSWVFYGESLGFPATLKIFRSEVPRDRCLAERDFLRQVSSPFVASFSSFMYWGGRYWCIAQEHAEGESLKRFIERQDFPDFDLFVEVANQTLLALEALHGASDQGVQDGTSADPVMHNDVTPGNIILDVNKRVAKLIDFGIASAPGLTLIAGTPGYVAQNLVSKDGYMASVEGDLFSLSVTLLEWATGKRPSSQEEVPVLYPDKLESTVSNRITKVFRRALGPSEQRFSKASSMREALEASLSEPQVGSDDGPGSEGLQAEDEAQPLFSRELESVDQAPTTGPRDVDNAHTAESFVEYLNTIHSVSADNRHALAEAQATSQYFQDLYVELDLTRSIASVLALDEDVVIMLTGHAGDGKSTVAVDLLKRARGLPADDALPEAPEEVEKVKLHGRPLSIVKDMSELSATDRLARFREAMEEKGSAVIVSNTGPLLSTFKTYFSQQQEERDVEQGVLDRLSQPLIDEQLEGENCFSILDGKKIYIANLSTLGNVNNAVKLLDKLIDHPAWDDCENCPAVANCPIRKNVELLRETRAVSRDRVRFVYQRLTAYGRRMTMRQLSAHLSFSLTGGLSCREVIGQSKEGHQRFTPVLFSESFFGHVGEKTGKASDALFCIRQMSDLHFGANSSPQLDQIIHEGRLSDFLDLPERLSGEIHRWQKTARDPAGGEARRRLRRLAYIFARPLAAHTQRLEPILIDEFLRSPMLRTLAQWERQGDVDTGLLKRKFIKKTIGVLMEEYIGSMMPEGAQDRLFITLRRPDERVFQSVQIVLKTVPIDEFDLIFDRRRALPVIAHYDARLELTLPLLDYVISRNRGELTGDLDAIHRASLEAFRAQLLDSPKGDSDVITVLQIDADGEASTHRFSVESEGKKLVYQ